MNAIEDLLSFHHAEEHAPEQAQAIADRYRNLTKPEFDRLMKWSLPRLPWPDVLSPSDCIVLGPESEVERRENEDAALAFQICKSLVCLAPWPTATWQHCALDVRRGPPSVFFREPADDVSARLVQEIESSHEFPHRRELPLFSSRWQVSCLAWAADETAVAALRRLHEEKVCISWVVPAGGPLYAAHYTEDAGWAFDPDGSRRDLFSPVCRPIVPASPGEVDDSPNLVVIGDHPEICLRCGRELTVMLDFDPSGFGLEGLVGPDRVRVVSCHFCPYYDTFYFREGDRWHPANTEPSDPLPTPKLLLRLPRGRLRVADVTRPWKDSLVDYLKWFGVSQIGGFPVRNRNLGYRDCPDCGRTMSFVGQIWSREFADREFDAVKLPQMIYHFYWCAACRLSATDGNVAY